MHMMHQERTNGNDPANNKSPGAELNRKQKPRPDRTGFHFCIEMWLQAGISPTATMYVAAVQ